MKKIICFIVFISLTTIANAQQVRPSNSGQIYGEIARLRHLTKVLYVAAHPDDENTRLLAWLVNVKHVRAAYLSLTRGDGGQNILGSEQGPALGLIRTHELMEARKLDGAEQFFTRAVDFGFSKNYQETFKHWDKDQLTSDVVWVMRKYRPDVVICRFPPDTRAGHGHHASSAILAAAAFKKAGDKTQYANQLEFYPAWQPKRILFNAFRFGSFNTTSEDMFKMPVGQYVPAIGMGVGELAGISRSVHKSQGAGTPSVPGTQMEYFQLVDGDSIKESIFDGIDITWNRIGRKDIGKEIEEVMLQFDYNHPDASIPALLEIRKKIDGVTDAYWRKEKLEELDNIILHCSGFMAELYTKQAEAVAGDKLPFTLHVIARSATPIKLVGINWAGNDTSLKIGINSDTMVSIDHVITIPVNTPITEPYWLSRPQPNPGNYAIPNDTLLGLPETPNNLNAWVKLKIGGEYFNVAIPLSYKKLDPVKGDVVEQLRIVPFATLEFTNNLVIRKKPRVINTDVRFHSNIYDEKMSDFNIIANNVVHDFNIYLTKNLDTILPIMIENPFENEEFRMKSIIRPTSKNIKEATRYKDLIYPTLFTQHLIQYNHLPTLQYFTPAEAKVINKDWKCTAKKIGYVDGAGDNMVAFLRQAGLEVDILKEADMTDANRLKKYDAIITGIRAVNVEKRMTRWLPVLFQYAQNGGTLVMQYNTLQDLSTTKIGPYPFELANLRVTEEDATVKFLHPENRLLNYPNKITQDDFKGWVQERGLYFTNKWDDRYTPIFEMNDNGEKALQGSTLYTKYGKGNYIYTSLSFFRQIPAGNKGAIRLLMNMLSVGK